MSFSLNDFGSTLMPNEWQIKPPTLTVPVKNDGTSV